MQTEPSAVDLLITYIKNLGETCVYSENERKLHLTPNDPFLNIRYLYFRTGRFVFVAYDSFAAKAHSSQTFTGMYTICKNNALPELSIYKKEWFDVLLRSNKRKTGINQIDRLITICSEKPIPLHLLLNEKFAESFVDMSREIMPLKTVIRDSYFWFIPEFSDKKVVGIETNQWLYKKEQLDIFIEESKNTLSYLF